MGALSFFSLSFYEFVARSTGCWAFPWFVSFVRQRGVRRSRSLWSPSVARASFSFLVIHRLGGVCFRPLSLCTKAVAGIEEATRADSCPVIEVPVSPPVLSADPARQLFHFGRMAARSHLPPVTPAHGFEPLVHPEATVAQRVGFVGAHDAMEHIIIRAVPQLASSALVSMAACTLFRLGHPRIAGQCSIPPARSVFVSCSHSAFPLLLMGGTHPSPPDLLPVASARRGQRGNRWCICVPAREGERRLREFVSALPERPHELKRKFGAAPLLLFPTSLTGPGAARALRSAAGSVAIDKQGFDRSKGRRDLGNGRPFQSASNPGRSLKSGSAYAVMEKKNKGSKRA